MLGLISVDFFGDGDNGVPAAFEVRRQGGFGVGLLLEDKGGEQGDDLFGLEVCEDVFEDEFGEHELVCGMYLVRKTVSPRSELPQAEQLYLAGDFSFELDT